jgi:hypothetical protein
MNVRIAPVPPSAIIAVCAVIVRMFVKNVEKYAMVVLRSARNAIGAKTV